MRGTSSRRSEALANVLDAKHYLWDRAKTEYEISKMRGSSLASEALPPHDRGTKRVAESDEAAHVSDTMTRSKRRRLRQAAKAKPSPAAKVAPVVQARPDKGKGKGKTKGMAVNQDLWAKIAEFTSGKRKFFNAGKCKFGEKCKDPHACCTCGGSHAFAASGCSKRHNDPRHAARPSACRTPANGQPSAGQQGNVANDEPQLRQQRVATPVPTIAQF